MDTDTRHLLNGMADEALDLAERLVGVSERLNGLLAAERSDEASMWMARAKKELAELIRSVEGR